MAGESATRRRVPVSEDTWLRLQAHQLRFRKKHPGIPGRVTYDDAIADLLDEVEGTA